MHSGGGQGGVADKGGKMVKLLLVRISLDLQGNRLRIDFLKYFESVNSQILESWHFISI